MSKSHFIAPQIPLSGNVMPVRLGTTGAKFAQVDEGKFVKLAAESQFNLCAAGDAIEGIVTSVEPGTSGGFAVGGIAKVGVIFATADGLQATPGTGTIAIGDYVCVGTVVALGTALSAPPKVCKATVQPGADPGTTAAAGTLIKAMLFAWRVVSLGTVGTGAVGTQIVIERVSFT